MSLRPIETKRSETAQPIRVLIVDDSAFARSSIERSLKTDRKIEIVGAAKDGLEAIQMVRQLSPDVVTLDVEMPRMNGLTALERIMALKPTRVVMLSSLTRQGSETTIKALELGAVDFVLKPSPSNPVGREGAALELLRKIKTAAVATLLGPRPTVRLVQPPQGKAPVSRRSASQMRKVVVIGSSTGGPRALVDLVPGIPAEIPAAFLLIQHMPAGFTRSLSERLDKASVIRVREAKHGDFLEPGLALLAPGGFHLTVVKGRVVLTEDPPVHGVRPSVDVTMESIVNAYGKSTVGVVLTGMGSDGTRGASLIRGAGGPITVQDEATCAVYGMPKSILDAGYANIEAPIEEIARHISQVSYGARPAYTRNIT